MADEQTVAEKVKGQTEAVAQADAATDGAQGDDLDTILKQFETVEENPKPEQTETDDIDVKSFVRDQMTRQSRADLDSAVAKVKELSGLGVSDKIIKATLNGLAADDPRLTRAWQNRHNDPAAWTGVLKGVAKSLRSEFATTIDRDASEDRAAIEAAVRGASTKTPEPDAPNFASMNDTQARAEIEKRYGYVPNF